jgi:hypothetical protein
MVEESGVALVEGWMVEWVPWRMLQNLQSLDVLPPFQQVWGWMTDQQDEDAQLVWG